MNKPLFLLRQLRSQDTHIRQGVIPDTQLPEKIPFTMWGGLIASSVVYGAVYFILRVLCELPVETVVFWSGVVFFIAMSFFYLTPVLALFIFVLIARRRPPRDFFSNYSGLQKTICVGIVAFLLLYAFNVGYPQAVKSVVKLINPPVSQIVSKPVTKKSNLKKIQATKKSPERVINDNKTFFSIWLLLFAGVGTVMTLFMRSCPDPSGRVHALKLPKRTRKEPILPFRLWIGQSTGWLATLSHGSSLAPHVNVALSLPDAAQNILVLGAIGSGKTTRAIHPLLIQLLDQHCGGLIFDIKGDFKDAVKTFSGWTNKHLCVVGPKKQPINLLFGLTPEVAASFLKSAFLLGDGGQKDPFWANTATELSRNILGILLFLPQRYSLHGLYHYLFDSEYRSLCHRELDTLRVELSESQERLLKAYCHYHEHIFRGFDDRVKSNVNATIAQVLSPFSHPDLIDAFCDTSEEGARMEAVLDGTVYLVDMPLSVWGLGGKVAYTLIKLRFFNVMQQRSIQPTWNQEQPVFFLCDEYQEIVSANKDGLSDLNFWDKARSTKTIGIISAQSVSSFYAALGDRDLTHALLQNFRQKLCFKTDDHHTLELLNHLAGKVEIAQLTESQTKGESSTTPTWGIGKSSTSESDSHTDSISYRDKAVIDAQLVRQLGRNQAIAFLSIQELNNDDVLNMQPVYV